MLDTLATFAALSMAGTVILSLLPDGGLKRSAGLAIGLLMILCWAEGISGMLDIPFTAKAPAEILIPTSVNIEGAATEATMMLAHQWEALP